MRRRLTSILSADIVGSSLLMGEDEEGIVTRVKSILSEIVEPEIEMLGGRMIKTMGDGFLAEFPSPVRAVRFAEALQTRMIAREVGPKELRVRFRVGINLGDIIEDDGDILGEGVNVAARLESIAPPNGLCISRSIHDQLNTKFKKNFKSLGSVELKNILEPVEVWQTVFANQEPTTDAPSKRKPDPTIAVQPFTEVGALEEDFFADGIVEEITSALSRSREFSVIARQSSYSVPTKMADIREVGKLLGATYVVTGSVRRIGSRVRISVQLSETVNGIQIWAEHFDDQIDDLFDLQDRIAGHVAGEVSPSIRASEIAAARATAPINRGAYAHYMSAYPHFWAHRKEENERAIELLTKSLEKDPNEARARALRAWCYAQQAAYMWTLTPLLSRETAFSDATEAELLADNHAPSLVAIGAAYSIATQDTKRSRSVILRALSIDPNSAWGWLRLGWVETYEGKCEEALPHFDRAEKLSPRDPFLFNIEFGRAFAYGIMGEYDRAIELAKKGLLAGPGVTWAYRDLASFLANAGRQQEADEAVALLFQHYPNLTVRRVIDGMPPAAIANHTRFIEGLRTAGMPES